MRYFLLLALFIPAVYLLTGTPTPTPLPHVPPGFEITKVSTPDLVSYPMMGTIDDQGRLFIAESSGNTLNNQQMAANPDYKIRLLEDRNHDGVYDHSTIFADHLTLPAGAVWLNGSLYVASPPDLLRFTDTDGDGKADKREVVVTGWNMSANAASLHGPFLGPDGYLYLTDGRHGFDITTKDAHYKGDASRIWRVRPDGTDLEWFAGGGFDNPVEVIFTPAGEMIGTMTYFKDPANGERDALLHFVEGGVYPKPHPSMKEFKRTGELMPVMTKFARIAPAGLLRYTGNAFGTLYQGNLFSAQFNPHRVQRHIVHRIGATFRTDDEDFMTSTDPDFHPTDVIQDKDGSILVLDTGAWFIHGCPISRVAKPEIKGAVYRIKRKVRPQPAPGRDREAAVAAVFHQSPEEVRNSLNSANFEIRTAAARCAGMSKDTQAVDRLIAMVKKDHPVPRRQAAPALGQIGDPKAVPALLTAAVNPDDRFVEHSIIYSLITLGAPQPVKAALENRSSKVRKAALIALDQMENAPIQRQQLTPALNDADPDLRHAALWIASRHQDWAGDVLKSIQARLRKGNFPPEEADALRQTLVSFCTDSASQQTMSDLLPDAFLLDVMDQCSVKDFPQVWVEALRRRLAGKDTVIRARVLSLVRSRQIGALDPEVERIGADASEQRDIRLAALSIVVERKRTLEEPGFRFLLGLLDPAADADLRQTAAEILGRAKLNEAQLTTLATAHLPQADPLILPHLLDAFRASNSEAVGKAMVQGLLNSKHPIDGIAAERVPELLKIYPASVHTAAEPILARIEKEKQSRAGRLKSLEPLLRGGDIDRGREIFFGKKAGCSSCHTIMAQGGDVGPDLTGVGAIRSGIDLLEAVVYPSASFVPGHEVYRVETKNDVYTGVQGEGSPEAVVIISGPRDRVRIPRKEIRSMRPSPVSLMPDGFADNLTHQELSNLLAFLQSQKSRPANP